MPSSFSLLRRHRPVLLRASTAALVLAGALSTVAGVSGPLPDRGSTPAARAHGEIAIDAPGAAPPMRAEVLREPQDPARHAARVGASAAAPAEPPPFAPGGDDLLPSSDDAARPSRATAADDSPAGARRVPAPRLWLERTSVGLGETAMLHLATADAASSCRGAAALEGAAISGARIGLRITTAGVHRLAVVCSAPGGATKSELLLTVPLPVALSSVENHRLLDQSPARLPGMNQLGLQAPAASSVLEKHLMVAGDFLQQGRLSLFVVAASAEGVAAYLMASDGAGPWRDRSAELLDNTQRAVCTSPTQAISSDFNRDGRPDVWIACDGRQLLFLSHADGRYRRIETPFELRARQAESRDVDGDGWPDIVTLDSSAGEPRTLLLLGRGDGRFEAGPTQAWGLSLPLSASIR